MKEDSWKPCWVRGSKIEDIIWIGKDVLAWCTGLYIIFFNLTQKKQTIRWCLNHETGEGACCLCGHSTLPIFAYCEKSPNPRILILTYPSMTKVSECVRGCPSGFLALAFTSRGYIVSLGLYPHFPLTIWCWKTGERIASVNTPIRDGVGQILRVTQVGPTVVAQMGRTCGRLFTWEVHLAGKVAILKDHEVKLPNAAPIYWIDWCPCSNDPLLAITDKDGHIYLSNLDGTDVSRIVLSQRCGVCLEIELPMVCWFRGGIVLRTTFCQIRFFKRNLKANMWHKEWYVKSGTKPCILVVHPFKRDRFFYHTLEGYLMQIDFPEDQNVPNIQKHLDYGAVFYFADLVYPWCHHLVVTDDLKELAVLECYSGVEVSRIDLEINGDVCCQASHLDYPLIGVGSSYGELVIVSVVDPDEPRVLAYVRLQRGPLDLIKFSYSGRHLVAAQKKSGNCYCVNLHREAYTVRALVQTHRRITDVLLHELRGVLKLLVLYVEANKLSVGQRLLLYELPEGQNLINEATDILDLPGVYRSLWHLPGNPQCLIGSPYLTRQLRVQKLQEFKDTIFVDSLASGHQVRLANIFVDRHWITSAAFDGLIFVRDKTVRSITASFMVHHRHDFGTVKVMANRSCDLIVCLGYNGSLVAVKRSSGDRKETADTLPENTYRVDYGWYDRQKKKILADYASLDRLINKLLTPPRKDSPPRHKEEPTWTEWRDQVQKEEEAKHCEEERTQILKDITVLKLEVKKLLDANESYPEIERLPVSSFDLDKAARDQKLKAAKDEREDVHQQLEHYSIERSKVSTWIKETFWDSQKVLGKSIFSIFDEKEVSNYPLTSEDPLFTERLQWAEFCKDTVYKIMEGDTFQPWRRYNEEELKVELNKRVKLFREDEKRRMDMLLEEEDHEADQEDPAFEGTTTYRFVEQSSHYYSQMESYGFAHVMMNNRFLKHDCNKLRQYFNKVFDDVYATKEREMNVIRERIERIRHIDAELRTMFGESVPCVPVDPEWHWKERPESIIQVHDHEVKARPYVSPSQQEILDKQAAEAERIRQLLLADDFRERALMAMMDGVLEVRWEDIIKIDVPKPRCMLDKNPGDYNAEDILIVKQYEKDVQFLREERERYKRILEADYVKVSGLLKEGIDKFNNKLDALFRLKLKIEAAINQMNLRYVRGLRRNYNRVKALDEEDKTKEKISEILDYETILLDQSQLLQTLHQDFLNQHEVLCNRERTMSRKFKHEFSSLGKLSVELLEAQYKRRPRTNLKNLSPSDFTDLGHHVTTQTSPISLPTECLEYLKALDHLDSRPTTLPPMIESSHWDHFIRLRRQRIDIELKIRSKQAEMIECEELIGLFDRKINKCKSDVNDIRRTIDEMRKGRLIYEQDLDVQLVLKMGQVEINLRGDREDAANAIFVSCTEIKAVNELIRAAGSCKLDALTRMMKFQRGTTLKEWQHECLKKRFEYLQEDVRHIQNVTVTKEIQDYLKLKARGLKDDKTPRRLDRQLETAKERDESIVTKRILKLKDIEKEIATTRSKNELLDRRIMNMNVTRCEMEQKRDVIAETKQQEYMERKIRMVMKRSDLIKKLQDNYAELLELQTEHELLRLRRYPMFHFKTLDDDKDKRNVS